MLLKSHTDTSPIIPPCFLRGEETHTQTYTHTHTHKKLGDDNSLAFLGCIYCIYMLYIFILQSMIMENRAKIPTNQINVVSQREHSCISTTQVENETLLDSQKHKEDIFLLSPHITIPSLFNHSLPLP